MEFFTHASDTHELGCKPVDPQEDQLMPAQQNVNELPSSSGHSATVNSHIGDGTNIEYLSVNTRRSLLKKQIDIIAKASKISIDTGAYPTSNCRFQHDVGSRVVVEPNEYVHLHQLQHLERIQDEMRNIENEVDEVKDTNLASNGNFGLFEFVHRVDMTQLKLTNIWKSQFCLNMPDLVFNAAVQALSPSKKDCAVECESIAYGGGYFPSISSHGSDSMNGDGTAIHTPRQEKAGNNVVVRDMLDDMQTPLINHHADTPTENITPFELSQASLFEEIQIAFKQVSCIDWQEKEKTKRQIKPEQFRINAGQFIQVQDVCNDLKASSFGDATVYLPTTIQEIKSRSFVNDRFDLTDIRIRMDTQFPVDTVDSRLNRNVISKLREQKKLIDRLKQDKATLEDQVALMQKDMRLQQQMHHSLVASKSLLDTNVLPHISAETNLGRSSIPGRSPARPTSQGRDSPRKVCAKVQISAAEQRELEILRLKVHNLENEKKQRNEEFATQTKTFIRRIKKLQQELSEREVIVMEKEAQINLLQIRCMHRPQLLQGVHATPRMLSDEMWLSVVPLKTNIETNTGKSNVSGAFDELLSKKLLESIRRLPGHYHEQWLKELQETAQKLIFLHNGLKAMSGAFHRLASCCDLYEMVRIISVEASALVHAEEAFVFVVDPVQKQEFWSRISRADGETVTARSTIPHISVDHQMSYTEYLAKQPNHVPHNTLNMPMNDISNDRDPVVIDSRAHLSQLLSQPPPGFAAYVYHTKEVLNIPGCKISSHPLFSGGSTSTDRFIKLKSSSTMLLPISNGDEREPIAILQVCGKTQHFRGMGVHVAVENCFSFTEEDKWLLVALANFCGGLLSKVMTFTEVERTRKSETVLLTLSRQIFTCLDFPKLSMLVMQSTKELLDTDRCTLFVTKTLPNNDHVLSSWQSDISSGTVHQTWKNRGHEIIVHFGQGIAGTCAETRRLINVPDAYEDKRFNKAWDEKTKYRTKSILAMPIVSSKDSLLGVIQMINKSGGTAFRAKDEEHITMVSQLIALAMENNNLFQKTQDVSKCIGTYIRHLPLNEALLNMSSHAEEIVGVQCACIYLMDERTNELFTFHRVRKTRVDLKPSSYKNSILEEALTLKEPLIVNNISQYAHYNAAVDTLNGVGAQQVMFVPLFQYGKNGIDDKVCIGLLHLVNRKGTTHDFDYDDSLVAIIANQVSGILMSIIERQSMHQLHEDTKMLLETCMSFYKELNHVGIMNAVYNATVSTFTIDKGQLWLWTEDKASMWTSKLLPSEEIKFVNPTLQRRLSVSQYERQEVSCSEGLLKRVVSEGKVISVKRWDHIGDGGNQEGIQRITPTDKGASFTDYSLTACPVWDSFGIEVIGVVMLMYPRGRNLHRLELSKIPIFTRQITGALMVCRDVSQHIHRVQRMQDMLEEYTAVSRASATLFNMSLVSVKPTQQTLSSKHGFSLAMKINNNGTLHSATYPINLFTRGSSFGSKYDILRLPVDMRGNRHIIQVTAASQSHYESNHFDRWMGRDIAAGDWEKIKYDLHNAFSRKETLTAYYSNNHAVSLAFVNNHDVGDNSVDTAVEALHELSARNMAHAALDLPDNIRREIAVFLWLFCTPDLKIHMDKVHSLFAPYDDHDSGRIDPTGFENVMKSWGIQLNHHEYDSLFKCFAVPVEDVEEVPYEDAASTTDGPFNVCYKTLFQTLAPHFVRHVHFQHEIFPTLHPTTHCVTSVQLFLTPDSHDSIIVPTASY
ncbi:Aste57867_9459 [Aphanomyces stellatus]|uniref:Aste57867_9459 protein n=1 Tax=Aphanomyces stellatus TaxID=120398 RepID=A0A485KND7_9STRA|nr:hypothetical protein As57867_009423 [Aphanomyces stellatus]VFT86338.1 Aste57867_9459 [Aphanomyces stellatus]